MTCGATMRIADCRLQIGENSGHEVMIAKRSRRAQSVWRFWQMERAASGPGVAKRLDGRGGGDQARSSVWQHDHVALDQGHQSERGSSRDTWLENLL